MLLHAHKRVLMRMERGLGPRRLLVSPNGRLPELLYLHWRVMQRILLRPASLTKSLTVFLALADRIGTILIFRDEGCRCCPWRLHGIDGVGSTALSCSDSIYKNIG